MKEKRSNYRRLLIGSALLLVAAAAVLVALGCYPGEINSVTELDVVFTMFDSTHVWTDPATFYLSDSVVQLQDTSDAGNNIALTHAFDSLILAETARGLLGYGFTQVDSSADPDYYVVASALAVRNWTVDVWYPYYPCCWYGGGWGWYYPPVYDVDTYETGTLFLDMYDRRAVDSTGLRIQRPWTGILNGLLGTSASVTQQRLITGIRQAYAQSPYLQPQ